MSDFLSDGYNLNDYVSDGQMFYKPTDKIRFEGALSALCDSRRHVMIVTDDTKLAERYYRYFITRIAIRNDIVLDTRAPTGADDVLNRFNKILSNASIESARREDANEVTHVMAMADTSDMSDNEWVVLGRLLKNFPGANIRMLAFVSEDQLEVIDEVLGKLDGQVYRWILTSPTAEYLEALLDIGEQFNYQAETRAMASALGYESKRFLSQTEDNPLDALDEIDRHLSAMETPSAVAPAKTGTGPTKEASKVQSNGDFDNDLKALLGAVRNLSAADAEENSETKEVTETDAAQKSRASDKTNEQPLPPRRLIWATAIAGISLIALAIFAPWESGPVESETVNAAASSRVFVDDPDAQAPSNKPDAEKSTANKPRAVPDLAATLIDSTATNSNAARSVSQPDTVADEPEGKAQSTGLLEPELGADVFEAPTQEIATTKPERNSEEPKVEAQQVVTPESEMGAEELDVDIQSVVTPESEPAAEELEVMTQSAPASGSELTREELEVETQPVSEAPRDRIIKAEPTSFFIQLGVYANQTQAQSLVDDLAASEPVFFLPLQKGSRVLQTVMSGPYPDRESAELAAGTRFSDSDTWVRSVNAIRNELIE